MFLHDAICFYLFLQLNHSDKNQIQPMTNITPATHKGLTELILRNIEVYKKNEDTENTVQVLRTNLETLKIIYGEYINKIREIRELVSLYDQVKHCVRTNVRYAKNDKNDSLPLYKTKVSFGIGKNASNTLEISELNHSGKELMIHKINHAVAASL